MRQIFGIASVLGIFLCSFTVQAAETVRMAVTMSLNQLPILIARDNGLFAKHDIAIDIVDMQGGGATMKAFIGGDVPIIAVGFPEIALLKGRGVAAQLLVSQLSQVPFALMARTDSSITAIADLKGKTVGISSPGSLTEYLGQYLAIKQGWDPKHDVSWVALGDGGSLLGAILGKKVEAAIMMEPFVTIGVQGGQLRMLADMIGQLDAFPTGPLMATGAFLEKSPKAAQGVHDAMVDALHIIAEDREGALAVAQHAFPGAKPEVLGAAFDRLYPVFSRDGKFSPESIQRTQEICKELGIIKEIYPYDALVAAIDR